VREHHDGAAAVERAFAAQGTQPQCGTL
jgi:hypothetical protein